MKCPQDKRSAGRMYFGAKGIKRAARRKRVGVLMHQSKGGTDDLPQGSNVGEEPPKKKKERNRFSIVYDSI